MIPIIEVDILTSDKTIIVQQVNCLGRMGKGLALSIMNRYDNVRKEYQAFQKKQFKKLGEVEKLLGLTQFIDVYDGKIIANIFGQVDIKKGPHDKNVYTKEPALLKGIEEVKNKAQALGVSVAIPTYIGCGLAGGDWNSIKPAIERIFDGSNVEVTFYHHR